MSMLLGSCAQLTPFHSARTEGAGNLTASPAIDGTVFIPSVNSTSFQGLPGGRVELAYGITNKIDILTSLYTSGSIMGSMKFQFLGDNESNIAGAVMPGYEYQSSVIVVNSDPETIHRIHVPLIFSIRANEKTDFYIGPKFTYQIDKDDNNTIYSGIVGGVELGTRIKYNIGLGAYLPKTQNTSTEGYLVQFGGSMRIPLFRK
ncbi:hypothetical protein [Portibacter lacus]|nr:hypothetical protein [Portibacter lacus]